jgi:hypothetical protein
VRRIAGITDAVPIHVGLICIGHRRAVVDGVSEAVAVAVGRHGRYGSIELARSGLAVGTPIAGPEFLPSIVEALPIGLQLLRPRSGVGEWRR